MTCAAVVYWLFDDTCSNPLEHGWIGTTTNWPHRLHRHRCPSENVLPVTEFKSQVLFKGSVKQCYQLERMLRPAANIGWNKLPGGRLGYAHRGVPKSPEQREKMRQAALARYAKPGEKERTSKAVKKGLRFVDRTGENNPMFGRKMSEATKQKIRDRMIERGGNTGKRNPNYRHGGYSDALDD